MFPDSDRNRKGDYAGIPPEYASAPGLDSSDDCISLAGDGERVTFYHTGIFLPARSVFPGLLGTIRNTNGF